MYLEGKIQWENHEEKCNVVQSWKLIRDIYQAIYQEVYESSSYAWTSVEKYSRKMQVQKLRSRINEKIELSHVESNFGGISRVHKFGKVNNRYR